MSVTVVPGRAGSASAAGFRVLMRSFPTGVAVVTAFDRAERPHGLTCTSLSSVCLTPPILMICLNTASGTLAAIREGGRFAVNLMRARGQGAAEVFASPAHDRFDRVSWTMSPRLGQPWLLDDAFAVAECVVAQTSALGDHEVVFGEVRNVYVGRGDPLMYGHQQFRPWATDGTR